MFTTLKAHWDLSGDGYVEPNRRLLIDLALRIAGTLQPGYAAARIRHPVASSDYADDCGGSLATEVYRLGDSERGVEVTDTVSNANDGMTPFEAATVIKVYGLPDGWTCVLSGTFIAPLYRIPNPARLEARLPETAAQTVATILREEFGATVAAD